MDISVSGKFIEDLCRLYNAVWWLSYAYSCNGSPMDESYFMQLCWHIEREAKKQGYMLVFDELFDIHALPVPTTKLGEA